MAGPGYVHGGASSHIGDSTLVTVIVHCNVLTVTVHCNVLYNICTICNFKIYRKMCSYFSGF